MMTKEDKKIEITIAKTAGFCFGVKRAIDFLDKLIKDNKKAATMGPIIHNKIVIEDLKRKGVRIVDDIDDINQNEMLVIRSHGAKKSIYNKINNTKMVDATCPFVSKIHQIVDENTNNGEIVLIAGDKTHAEVVGIKSFVKTKSYVFSNEIELEDIIKEKNLYDKNLILVSQTTFLSETFKKSCKILKKMCTFYKIFDTICKATQKRQSEADKLSKEMDLMIIVGDKLSSNTQKLLKTCKKNCYSLLIESKDDLNLNLSGFKKIGITAGASTPAYIIEEVKKMVEEFKNNEMENEEKMENQLENQVENQNENEEDFLELLNNSSQLSYVKMGAKVKGTVISVTKSEAQIDLGCKQTGIIPMSELSRNGALSPEEVLKVGDEVEAIVIKKNDQDGIITLSKKRVDEIKGYEKMVEAYNDRTILEGKVVSVIKGGVLVLNNDIDVFIPMSQLSYERVDDPNKLLAQDVKFRIIEANVKNKKAVGSIKSVLNDEKSEVQKEFWNDVEIGKKYEGIVRTLTSYGAFVDIGGVDGMIHISDLSWSRVKHPSDILKVGDKVEVYVKDINEDTHKIALGYKKTEEKPFEQFKQKFHVGDVIEVKITGLTGFGAFAEIMPGVEGLIHISQISHDRVEKAADVLEMDQTVKVKIIKIDNENETIGLSIKALLQDKRKVEEEENKKAIENIDGVELN